MLGIFVVYLFGGVCWGFSWKTFLGTSSHINEEEKSNSKIRRKDPADQKINIRKNLCSAEASPNTWKPIFGIASLDSVPRKLSLDCLNDSQECLQGRAPATAEQTQTLTGTQNDPLSRCPPFSKEGATPKNLVKPNLANSWVQAFLYVFLPGDYWRKICT